MPATADERSPLLQFPGSYAASRVPVRSDTEFLSNAYEQFCHLIGNRPLEHPQGKSYTPPKDSLYHRALEHRKAQSRMYAFTSALTNTLLLSQIVLGASLTGMGASNSPRWLITVFGALNTIIAGLVAFLKSRGQPMRARMFRDDLDRVVDEIENSATMWRGISQGIHGYDAIDTDEAVTVRSEVARLTRLYDRAVKTNTLNDPDYYNGAGISSDPSNSGLRSGRPQPQVPAPAGQLPAPAAPPQDTTPVSAPVVNAPVVNAPAAADPDESPATKAPASNLPKEDTAPAADQSPDIPSDAAKVSEPTPSDSAIPPAAADPAPAPPSTHPQAATATPVAPTIATVVVVDPDASPATAPRPPGAQRRRSDKQHGKVTEDLSQSEDTVDGGSAKTGST